MPGWQALHEELEGFGFTVIAVALDETEAAREWIEGANPTYPCLIDPGHVVAERYGFINVPSVVWIDEDDMIVRPPDIAPVNDLFKDFTGIESEVHHEALRAWVRDGVAPMTEHEAAEKQHVPSEADELARLHRRIAAQLHRDGRSDGARHHFEIARGLAPWDWTIHRGSMPLTGGDPFGQGFFDYVEAWGSAGAPGYAFGNAALRTQRATET